MKSSNIIPVVLIAMSSLTAAAQDQDQGKIPGGIAIAIKAGNAADLSKYMNSTIELLLLDKEDFYKKNVAETILKDFFAEYHAKDFTRVQKMMLNMPLAALRQRKETFVFISFSRKLIRNC